jgi:hypothetical protein
MPLPEQTYREYFPVHFSIIENDIGIYIPNSDGAKNRLCYPVQSCRTHLEFIIGLIIIDPFIIVKPELPPSAKKLSTIKV